VCNDVFEKVCSVKGQICMVQRYIKVALCDVSVCYEKTLVLTNIILLNSYIDFFFCFLNRAFR
jgi:hypothetical protein